MEPQSNGTKMDGEREKIASWREDPSSLKVPRGELVSLFPCLMSFERDADENLQGSVKSS